MSQDAPDAWVPVRIDPTALSDDLLMDLLRAGDKDLAEHRPYASVFARSEPLANLDRAGAALLVAAWRRGLIRLD